MSTPARRRLLRDFKRITQDAPSGIIAAPDATDLLVWQAVIFGPEETPWEGGTFKLQMKFAEEYPNKPPVVKFITKLFHPNIYTDGAICLDILANQWSPIYDVAAILSSIQSLLTDPNPNSPANVEAAKLYVENRREYDRKVTETIEGLWKLEEASEEEGKDDEEEEEPEEDPEDAPRKKQKISEVAAKNSNAVPTADAAAAPAAASSSSSSSAASAPASAAGAPPAASSSSSAAAALAVAASSSSHSQPAAAGQ